MDWQLTTVRLHFSRHIYLYTFLGFGLEAWAEVIEQRQINSGYGFAYSCWAAYPLLMLPGLRDPQKIVPLLKWQVFYKLLWIVLFAVPLWLADNLDALVIGHLIAFAVAMAMDFLAFPWPPLRKILSI